VKAETLCRYSIPWRQYSTPNTHDRKAKRIGPEDERKGVDFSRGKSSHAGARREQECRDKHARYTAGGWPSGGSWDFVEGPALRWAQAIVVSRRVTPATPPRIFLKIRVRHAGALAEEMTASPWAMAADSVCQQPEQLSRDDLKPGSR